MQTFKHISIIDEMHPALMEGLLREKIPFTYSPDISSSEILKNLQYSDGLLLRSKIKVTREVILQNPQLKFIGRGGAGLDNIDVDFAMSQGIRVFNSAEANADAVGEHALGVLLGLSSKIIRSNREVISGEWNRELNRGFELKGKTIGIIGFGNTGKAVAAKLSGFGCEILAYDKYVHGFQADHQHVVETTLENVTKHADVISFHVPLTKETKQWINKEFISQVQKPFVLLNLSRGGIMKTEDILDGLDAQKISFFGTDVLENEDVSNYNDNDKDIFNNLNQRDNVIVTPHVAGWTKESYEKISKVILQKVLDFRNNNEIRIKSAESVGES
jgi:D-3-phosphoglycerate dehydrogenase